MWKMLGISAFGILSSCMFLSCGGHVAGDLQSGDGADAAIDTGIPVDDCQEGLRCAKGRVCHANRCVDGCSINGEYYPHGTENPLNRCVVCTSASETSWTPVRSDECIDMARISASRNHTCAISPSGGLKCWGANSYSKLGTDGGPSSVPAQVVGLESGVEAVASGGSHTCAVTKEGSAFCWGMQHQYVYHGISMGSVVGCGCHCDGGGGTSSYCSTPVPVFGLTSGVNGITAGDLHACANTSSGSVLCWGHNCEGSFGYGSQTFHSEPNPIIGLASGVVAISAGSHHTCALTSVGGVLCWGNAHGGLLGDGKTESALVPVAVTGLESGVAAISAGDSHTCALTAAGRLLCWGENNEGQLGNGTTDTSIFPVPVVGLEPSVAAVSAGYQHTCAITTQGKLFCWGSNGAGQLGVDVILSSESPVPVDGLSSAVIAVSAGGKHTCAVTQTGSVLCWGSNESGQLGDGTYENRWVPAPVTGFP